VQVNGNRVFVFSGEGQLMQMARDLVNRVTNRAGDNVPPPAAEVVNHQQTDEGNVPIASTLTTNDNSSTDPSASSADPKNATDADGLNLDIHSVIGSQQQQHNQSQLDIDTLNPCGIQDIELNVTENIDTVVDRTVLTNAEIHADNVYHQIQSLPTQHLSGRNNFQSILLPSISSATIATINNTCVANSAAGSNNINNSSIIATEITTTANTRNSEIEAVEEQSSSVFSQPLSAEGGLVGELSGPGLHDNVQAVNNLISESTTTENEIKTPDTAHGNSSVE